MKSVFSLFLPALFAAALLAAPAKAQPAKQQENRFLIVIDTAAAMRGCSNQVETALGDLLRSKMKGEFRPGDTIGLWTYSDRLETDYPMRTWKDSGSQALLDDMLSFLRGHRYANRARLDKALPPVRQVIEQSQRMTVIFIYDGADEMTGTPYDSDINALQKRFYREFHSENIPFVTVLAARDGKLFDYTVNTPQSISIPHTALPAKPAVTNAPPVAKAAPVAVTNPPPHKRIELVMVGSSAATNQAPAPAKPVTPTPPPPARSIDTTTAPPSAVPPPAKPIVVETPAPKPVAAAPVPAPIPAPLVVTPTPAPMPTPISEPSAPANPVVVASAPTPMPVSTPAPAASAPAPARTTPAAPVNVAPNPPVNSTPASTPTPVVVVQPAPARAPADNAPARSEPVPNPSPTPTPAAVSAPLATLPPVLPNPAPPSKPAPAPVTTVAPVLPAAVVAQAPLAPRLGAQSMALLVIAFSLLAIAVALVWTLVRRGRNSSSLITESINRRLR